MILYLGSDNVLRARGVYSLSLTTGLPVYLDGTVITAHVTLLHSTGDEVSGETWPVAFSYIAGSQGDFLAILRDTLEVTAQEALTAHVVFSNGADQLGDWRGMIYVQRRDF